MKEVLLVTGAGEVYTDFLENRLKRHDELIAGLLKNQFDEKYEIKGFDRYDNAKSATKDYHMLTIMDDILDMVVMFPDVITDKQILYFVDNLFPEKEEKRVHMVKYYENEDTWKELSEKRIIKLYEQAKERQKNERNR